MPVSEVNLRRGAVVGGSSLMSSAWRATGVTLPLASVSVIVMWSVLNACADGAAEPIASNVATSSARSRRPSSAPGKPMSMLEPGYGRRLAIVFGGANRDRVAAGFDP